MILDECDSTNAEIRRRLGTGITHGFWLSAKKQTAGRGRQGRTWISEEGNLFLSVLLQAKSLESATWIPLMAAVSAASLLNELGPQTPIEIKWPNDLYLGGVKCGGILVEGLGSSAENYSFILGIGLNITESPQDIDQPTAFLLSALPKFNLENFRSKLVKKILEDFDFLRKGEVSIIRDLYLKNSFFKKGTEVSWESVGEEPGIGTVLGLGEQGQLIVQNKKGEEMYLYAADVKIRVKA